MPEATGAGTSGQERIVTTCYYPNDILLLPVSTRFYPNGVLLLLVTTCYYPPVPVVSGPEDGPKVGQWCHQRDEVDFTDHGPVLWAMGAETSRFTDDMFLLVVPSALSTSRPSRMPQTTVTGSPDPVTVVEVAEDNRALAVTDIQRARVSAAARIASRNHSRSAFPALDGT